MKDKRAERKNSDRLVGPLKHHHNRILTVIGLWSLMMLQYTHEGHVDEHVAALADEYLLETEYLYFEYAVKALEGTVPF